MKLYRSYMFKDQDPAIDELRKQMQRVTGKRKLAYADLKQVEKDGGPTVSCMNAWWGGRTKRPQNATLEAAGRALGLRREWVKDDDKKGNGK